MTKTLDLNTPQTVRYCIPKWLRDEQIKSALQRPIGRIQPGNELRVGPIAVVGFGPSLEDTWEQIRGHHYIMSCSGSHKFLLERGIVPTWHVEVDPRDHKVGLIGPPHPDVEYLIASTCHPKVFDHLAGFNVKLWHVFDPTDDGRRMLPSGEWAVTGGCDVGLRALTLAAFLGFKDLQVFGLDGCAKAMDTRRHAADHPNGKQPYAVCSYEGVDYYTTPAMLEAAKQTFHELDQLPLVVATFHGEGLIQAMAKKYEAKTATSPVGIAFNKPALISAEYVALNAQLHRENLAYGVGGGRHAETVQKLAATLKQPSILDYGCGKGYMAKALPWPIWEYDPAIPEKSESPRPADLVVCTDVLEHIEPEKLVFVLDDLRRCVKQLGFFVIHTGPAAKSLPDGRNTHLIQHGEEWWRKRLERFFTVGAIKRVGKELHVVVGPKMKKAKTSVAVASALVAQV